MKRLPLIIFAILVVFLVIGLTLKPKEIPSPFIGKPAPAFELSILSQTERFEPKSMLGRVWLLNVWASWCTSCREEHPLLIEFSKQKLVPIIGLNYKDKDPEAIKWLNDLGNPYDFSVVDAKGKVGIDYGVYGVPETFVIDKSGKIVHKHIGPLTPEALNKDILPLLKKLNS
ncbi:DsbE family thiol:disulfide interchange protein [Polynucleobacter rarus]|jgi:cytochrome c biogenesis protein CcmG/thiol:disulfide interchange protein DsbE|uniref:DsbE family thiol:disulfide interchange protein n=1 Tax=Polynucleobacter rarus TaxID=556055 RepID=UPI000D3E6578|nr:DsbE family thiol:disulfide interchange protein [Polynucleobacter rarus]